jgi:hypothetical protein
VHHLDKVRIIHQTLLSIQYERKSKTWPPYPHPSPTPHPPGECRSARHCPMPRTCSCNPQRTTPQSPPPRRSPTGARCDQRAHGAAAAAMAAAAVPGLPLQLGRSCCPQLLLPPLPLQVVPLRKEYPRRASSGRLMQRPASRRRGTSAPCKAGRTPSSMGVACACTAVRGVGKGICRRAQHDAYACTSASLGIQVAACDSLQVTSWSHILHSITLWLAPHSCHRLARTSKSVLVWRQEACLPVDCAGVPLEPEQRWCRRHRPIRSHPCTAGPHTLVERLGRDGLGLPNDHIQEDSASCHQVAHGSAGLHREREQAPLIYKQLDDDMPSACAELRSWRSQGQGDSEGSVTKWCCRPPGTNLLNLFVGRTS